MLEWRKHRHDVTCEVYYTLHDHDYPDPVARIYKRGKPSKPFRVKILERAPWHRKTLKSAKADAEWVYLNTPM